uniref:Uncharacterized protein n=1 Tax=Ditylenchus dipsaci TaxID=166011 RepID=A0A915DV96_9BILA
MGPCQAYTCITDFPIVHKSNTVYSLPIHEEGQEPVFFGPGQEVEAARRILEGRGRRSELKALFELCQKQKQIIGEEENIPRDLVTQIYMAPPRKPQLFAQRLLLLNVRGPQGFRELRTVNGQEYPDMVQAAQL